MKILKPILKKIIVPRRIWLFLIYPFLYGIPLLIANATSHHDVMTGLGYWGFFLSAPSSYLVIFIVEKLPFVTDAYRHLSSFVAGTIQWGIILHVFSRWVSNSNKDKYDGFEELRKNKNYKKEIL